MNLTQKSEDDLHPCSAKRYCIGWSIMTRNNIFYCRISNKRKDAFRRRRLLSLLLKRAQIVETTANPEPTVKEGYSGRAPWQYYRSP